MEISMLQIWNVLEEKKPKRGRGSVKGIVGRKKSLFLDCHIGNMFERTSRLLLLLEKKEECTH